MTDHYVDSFGVYIGGYGDGAEPETEGLILVDYPPEYADQVWQFPGWSPSPSALAQAETVWRHNEMLFIADQLLRIEDNDPTALPGTAKQWRDYRIDVRAWIEGANNFPNMDHRPVRPQ